MKNQAHFSGFTLVEMAVVLVIVGLMLGGLLIPLSAQMDQSRVSEARKDLSEIKEALIGYAIINGHLPCPDTDGDGIENSCGTTTSAGSSQGNLPWATLGVQGTDPWGRHYQYRVNDAFGAAGTPFSLSTTGTTTGILRICSDKTCAATLANNVPAVIYSSGKNGAVQPPVGADELENTTDSTSTKFDRSFVSHEFSAATATYGEFDDIVTWIAPSILMSRMVSAGKLP